MKIHLKQGSDKPAYLNIFSTELLFHNFPYKIVENFSIDPGFIISSFTTELSLRALQQEYCYHTLPFRVERIRLSPHFTLGDVGQATKKTSDMQQ